MTTAITPFNKDVFIAPQITEEDVGEASRLGIKTVVNLRVAEEEGFHDFSAEFAAVNIRYLHIPIDVSTLTPAQADHAISLIAGASKPALIFCRSSQRAKALLKAQEAIESKSSLDSDHALDSVPEKLREFVKQYTERKVKALLTLPEPVWVSDTLIAGAQPSEEILRDLALKGAKSVVNLRESSEIGSLGMNVLQHEEEIVKSLGLTYAHFPISIYHVPTEEQKAGLRELLATLPAPHFVHCKRMNRTNVVLGLGLDIPTAAVVETFFETTTNTAQYIVIDPASGSAAIIDSVLVYYPESGRTSTKEADLLVKFVRDNQLHVEYILETHVHADHLTASHYLKSVFPDAKIGIGAEISKVQATFGPIFNLDIATDGSQFDILFKDGDKFSLGFLRCNVLWTPGHTPACVTYVIGDAAFCGDTIFMPDMGSARCDFPGGSSETLHNSIQNKLYTLPDATRLFVGHDYAPGGREFAWETTIGENKRKNLHISEGKEVGEFCEWRKGRDATLGLPRLLFPALQVNMLAGAMPKPDSNGTVYFKIPINKF